MPQKRSLMFRILTLVDNVKYNNAAKALFWQCGRDREDTMSSDRATKMLILSSARTLFSEKGYDETLVEEICTLAGVAKGTFFYHFESKQFIVRYIIAAQLYEFSCKLKEQINTFKDAISKTEYFVLTIIEQSEMENEAETYFKNGKPEWFKTVLSEERMNALYPLLEDIVREGIADGVFKVKNLDVCTAVAFQGIDAVLYSGRGCQIGSVKKGIREMTAKTLGLKETAFAI